MRCGPRSSSALILIRRWVQARAVLGFPDQHFIAYVLSVGYPSDKPLAVIERLNRRPFEEVVHRGRW